MDTSSTRSSISSPVMNSAAISDKDHQLLSTKYTKLAAEYSKVRAQLGVLKKAVLEEQAKNVGSSDNLKQKEQALRKSEAEMDSLTFRNQQLTRRVEILQDDLEKKALDGHGGTSRKKSSALDSSTSSNTGTGSSGKIVSGHLHRDTDRVSASESLNSVMGEELQLKIAENARLHAALDGVDKRYEDRILGLQSRIRELESTASKQAQAERADDTRLKELVHGLKIENADLTSSAKKFDRDLEDKNDRIMMLQVQLESTMSAASSTATDDTKSAEKLNPFKCQKNSTEEITFDEAVLSPLSSHQVTSTSSRLGLNRNSVQPPLTSTEARIQTVELLSQMGENVQEIIAAMSDLHTYWEHRIKDTHADGQLWTDSSKKLQKHLLENVRFLKPVEQAFQDVLSGLLTSQGKEKHATSLSLPNYFSTFACNLQEYVNYTQNTIEPLLLATLREESSKISCSSTQQAANSRVQSAVKSFNSILSQVTIQITLLTGMHLKPDKNTSLLEEVENLAVEVSQLLTSASNLSSEYQSKASDEAELPTVSSALRNTNQCVVAATVSLTSGLENLSRNLSHQLPRIDALLGANFDLISSDVILVESNDNNIKDSDNHELCHSKGTHPNEALVNDNTLSQLSLINEMNEKVDNLKQQSDNLNERLKKAEQEKEHWKVEYQLVQMKHDKLKDKFEDRQNKQQVDGDCLEDNPLDLGIIESEDKCIYENRISELVADRLLADSKAAHFYLECAALQKHVQSREKKKFSMEQELQNAQDKISNLHDGIGTTNSNYEEQISMLSEHVANMNEKLAQKTEEVQKLQFEASQKRQKGGKR